MASFAGAIAAAADAVLGELKSRVDMTRSTTHVSTLSPCVNPEMRKAYADRLTTLANGRSKSMNRGGLGLGGILVIIGIIVALVWSLWLGIIIALIGLIAFGGFVRGKWY